LIRDLVDHDAEVLLRQVLEQSVGLGDGAGEPGRAAGVRTSSRRSNSLSA